jgi:hypothetical protein
MRREGPCGGREKGLGMWWLVGIHDRRSGAFWRTTVDGDGGQRRQMGWIRVRDATVERRTRALVDRDGGSSMAGVGVVDGGSEEGAIDGGVVGGC